MLAEAQDIAPGLAPHYYVAGRASLPLFAYVGLRRGRLGELTAWNQRGRTGTSSRRRLVRAPAVALYLMIGGYCRGDLARRAGGGVRVDRLPGARSGDRV